MTDNTSLFQALQAIQQQLQQQSQQLQQQSQEQVEQNTKILEALNIREQPKRDNSRYGSSSDEEEEGKHVNLANQQRNRMPRIKADIPTFLGSLNIEYFLDWVFETEKYFELMDIPEDSQVKYVAYKLRGAASSWWDNLQTEGDKAHSESEDEGLIISPNAVFKDDDDHSEAFLGKENTYTLSKRGRKFTLCPYSDEVQATTTKEKKNRIMLCSTRNNDKNICVTTISPDKETFTFSWFRIMILRAKEFMRLASRNQLSKSDAQQVARFNNGLRCDIQAIVSLQTTWTIDEAVRIALKVELTIKNRDMRVNLAEGDKAHSESEDEGLIISPNAVFEDDDDHSEAFLGMDCHYLLGRPWQSDLNVVHKRKENTYTLSKRGRKFTLCPYSDEVQATTTKEKNNRIMLCSTRNKDKNICVTTIFSDKVLNPIRNSWSSSFQEGENDGGP
nr:Gag-Pol polyprotein-like protein [Tanacetum cinerariifolium]